jgi:aarF domain-containing kinase
LSKFQCNFIEEIADGVLKVPQVVTGLVRPAVLVETWDHGSIISSIFDTNISENAPMSIRKRLAKHLFDTSFKMFLRDNFVHADLHAGNILYSSSPSNIPGSQQTKESLTLLDAGLTASLSDDMVPVFNTFLIAMCRMEAKTICDCLVQFNRYNEPNPRTESEMQHLQDTVQSVIDRNADENGRSRHDGGPVNVGFIMGGIMRELKNHHIKLKGDVAFCVCVISLIEGLIRQLHPEFDMFDAAMPYFHKYNLIDIVQKVESRVESRRRNKM